MDIENDEERLDAGLIARDIAKHIPDSYDRQRRVFEYGLVRVVHQTGPGKGETTEVYFDGVPVYIDRRSDTFTPQVVRYKNGLWETLLQDPFVINSFEEVGL